MRTEPGKTLATFKARKAPLAPLVRQAPPEPRAIPALLARKAMLGLKGFRVTKAPKGFKARMALKELKAFRAKQARPEPPVRKVRKALKATPGRLVRQAISTRAAFGAPPLMIMRDMMV